MIRPIDELLDPMPDMELKLVQYSSMKKCWERIYQDPDTYTILTLMCETENGDGEVYGYAALDCDFAI